MNRIWFRITSVEYFSISFTDSTHLMFTNQIGHVHYCDLSYTQQNVWIVLFAAVLGLTAFVYYSLVWSNSLQNCHHNCSTFCFL